MQESLQEQRYLHSGVPELFQNNGIYILECRYRCVIMVMAFVTADTVVFTKILAFVSAHTGAFTLILAVLSAKA